MALTEEQIVSELNAFMIAQDPNFVPPSIKVVEGSDRGTMISIWMEQYSNMLKEYLKIPTYFEPKSINMLLIDICLNMSSFKDIYNTLHTLLIDHHVSAMVAAFNIDNRKVDSNITISELVNSRSAFTDVVVENTDSENAKSILNQCIEDIRNFSKESEKILDYVQISKKFIDDAMKMPLRFNYRNEMQNHVSTRIAQCDTFVANCDPNDLSHINDHLENLISDLSKCIAIILSTIEPVFNELDISRGSYQSSRYSSRHFADPEYRRMYGHGRDWEQYERDFRKIDRGSHKSYPSPSTKSFRDADPDEDK